jgi:ribonuclease HI
VDKTQQLYLLDGSSYIYRAYYGIRERATIAGMATNAIFGFVNMLLALRQEYQPDYLAVVFDRPREETFRRELYPAYKANRDATPEDLLAQIPYIKQLLHALNIPALEAPGFEADDVIATLAKRYATQELQVTVVTGDKDLLQVVNENISLLDTMKDKRSLPADVCTRFGVSAELVPDVLGLAGDTADNIPGVPGVGEKTAANLIQRFDCLDGVFKWRHLVKGTKRKENLRSYEAQARLSKILATVRYDVDIDIPLAALRCKEANCARLLPLLAELEFTELATAFTPPAPGVVELYSDGSGTASGPGGYGVVLRYGAHEKELSGFEPEATSQRMEQLAAIRGLEALTKPQTVQVFSDSQYLVRGMNEWLSGWIRNKRLDTPGALANQDLWQQLAALADIHQVSWHWVRGHSGQPFNERCDKLAKRAVVEGVLAAESVAKPAIKLEENTQHNLAVESDIAHVASATPELTAGEIHGAALEQSGETALADRTEEPASDASGVQLSLY